MDKCYTGQFVVITGIGGVVKYPLADVVLDSPLVKGAVVVVI